ncbi:4'-phosphopantetheinyl transferase, partial [Streptomyces sp. NPDC003832]
MIEELLPAEVVTVEAYGDEDAEGTVLYPEEAAVVTRAVDKRRREFAAVRGCARRAMEKLGVPPQPLGRSPRRAAAPASTPGSRHGSRN